MEKKNNVSPGAELLQKQEEAERALLTDFEKKELKNIKKWEDESRKRIKEIIKEGKVNPQSANYMMNLFQTNIVTATLRDEIHQAVGLRNSKGAK